LTSVSCPNFMLLRQLHGSLIVDRNCDVCYELGMRRKRRVLSFRAWPRVLCAWRFFAGVAGDSAMAWSCGDRWNAPGGSDRLPFRFGPIRSVFMGAPDVEDAGAFFVLAEV